MSEKTLELNNELHLFNALLEAVNERSAKAYLVGGVVRDLLIHKKLEILDYDFVVTAPAGEIARAVQKKIGGQVREFPDFRTAKIISPELIPGLPAVDFVGARKESYPRPGVLPVTEAGSLSSDLARRDFTLNAMALDLEEVLKLDAGQQPLDQILEHVIDPFNGRQDILDRKIRVLHNQSFIDDPSRILRAVRYRVRFDFTYDAETERLKKQAILSGALSTIQPYRILNEFRRYCFESNFPAIFEELIRFGVLDAIELKVTERVERFAKALENLGMLSFAGGDLIYSTLLSLLFYLSGQAGEQCMKRFNVRGDIKDNVIKNIASLGQVPDRLEAAQLIFNAVLDPRFPDSNYLSQEVRRKIEGR